MHVTQVRQLIELAQNNEYTIESSKLLGQNN